MSLDVLVWAILTIASCVLVVRQGVVLLQDTRRTPQRQRIEPREGDSLALLKEAYASGRIELDEFEDHLSVLLGGEVAASTAALLRSEREERGWKQAESWSMPVTAKGATQRGRPYRVVNDCHVYDDGRVVYVGRRNRIPLN